MPDRLMFSQQGAQTPTRRQVAAGNNACTRGAHLQTDAMVHSFAPVLPQMPRPTAPIHWLFSDASLSL